MESSEERLYVSLVVDSAFSLICWINPQWCEWIMCRVLDVTEWSSGDTKYDVISCLNVLDRCEKPLSLLNQIKSSLKPDGIAVISFVIPFNPYVEFGNFNTFTYNISIPIDLVHSHTLHVLMKIFFTQVLISPTNLTKQYRLETTHLKPKWLILLIRCLYLKGGTWLNGHGCRIYAKETFNKPSTGLMTHCLLSDPKPQTCQLKAHPVQDLQRRHQRHFGFQRITNDTNQYLPTTDWLKWQMKFHSSFIINCQLNLQYDLIYYYQ